MALIRIIPDGPPLYSGAVLTEPDEDGDYGWSCACGASSETDGSGNQPIGDAVSNAEIHVDDQCRLRVEL